ncbi:MAG: tRNA 2-thiouridine(34) synthase MnmA, partial [Desulfovibrionaceae bacterium]|nr:tRNA 2-thiouridine(34) synthase MnmA [Desulfovibrionaceae bacterium]
EPLYVTGKSRENNVLLLGTRDELGMRGCRTGTANLLVAPELWPDRLLARVRYRQREMPAAVSVTNGCLHIRFEEPRTPSAPGQIAVVYDADGVVLAGGVIEETE